MKRSKRYQELVKDLDLNKVYSVEEAVEILKEIGPKPKFDETVEVNLALNVDPRKPDQLIRGAVVLPHGLGKEVRVVVICSGEAEKEAKEAGADYVGGKELIDKIASGWLDFDSVIATPDMMRELSKLGRILGPRGLMPSPKTGTVTQDVAKAVREVKAGKVEFKTDRQGCINAGVGKISFPKEHLVDNIMHFVERVKELKPQAVKGNLIKSAYVSTSMGPGLKISV